MALTIKKGWWNKIAPLPEEDRKNILYDITMYYYADIESDYSHPVKDFIIEDINKRKKPKVRPAWRDDFEAYKTDVEKGLREVLTDIEWMAERAKVNPTLDIGKTLEKAVLDFWGTERGWANKKRRSSNNINWRSTFTNAINQKWNHVYLQRGERNTGELQVVWEFDGRRRKTAEKAYIDELGAYGSKRVKFIRKEL